MNGPPCTDCKHHSSTYYNSACDRPVLVTTRWPADLVHGIPARTETSLVALHADAHGERAARWYRTSKCGRKARFFYPKETKS